MYAIVVSTENILRFIINRLLTLISSITDADEGSRKFQAVSEIWVSDPFTLLLSLNNGEEILVNAIHD